MPNALADIQALLDKGDNLGALRAAAAWPTLGVYREPITRGAAASRHPDTYAAMGYVPAALVAAGIAAVRAMVAGGVAPSADCGLPHPVKGCNCVACRRARPKAKAISPLTKRGP